MTARQIIGCVLGGPDRGQDRITRHPAGKARRPAGWRSRARRGRDAGRRAIDLGSTQVPGITVGIRRLGFTVVSSTPPRTGFCRIAGSATCSFLSLTGHETQTYTLTLRPQAPGTYTLQGWTTQPSTGRGFGASVTVTVTP